MCVIPKYDLHFIYIFIKEEWGKYCLFIESKIFVYHGFLRLGLTTINFSPCSSRIFASNSVLHLHTEQRNLTHSEQLWFISAKHVVIIIYHLKLFSCI